MGTIAASPVEGSDGRYRHAFGRLLVDDGGGERNAPETSGWIRDRCDQPPAIGGRGDRQVLLERPD